MSHIAKIELEIHDLEALTASAKALGLEFIRDQKTYKWYGRVVGDYPLPQGFAADDFGKCEHALRVKGNKAAYEIGVVTRRDGKPGYTLLWDFWQGGFGLQEKVGVNGNRFKQEYSLQVGTRWARKQGLRVTRTTKEDGRVILRAS